MVANKTDSQHFSSNFLTVNDVWLYFGDCSSHKMQNFPQNSIEQATNSNCTFWAHQQHMFGKILWILYSGMKFMHINLILSKFQIGIDDIIDLLRWDVGCWRTEVYHITHIHAYMVQLIGCIGWETCLNWFYSGVNRIFVAKIFFSFIACQFIVFNFTSIQ